MIKRALLLTPVLLAAALLVALFWPRGAPVAAALPETVQTQFYNMTVTTSDGREFELPDKTVTCSLDSSVSAEEGLYSCPAPHDIDALLSPAKVSLSPVVSSVAVLIEIDAATLAYGLPANSWQTLQIYYGTTLSSANVMLGTEFTNGQSGHIENVVWPDISRGVHPIYFYYRGQTNSSGSMGTEWLARGTQ